MENCEEVLGVFHQGTAYFSTENVTSQKTIRHVHSTFDKGREAKVQQKPGVNIKLSMLLTGAHLAQETREVREVDQPYIEHAGEHDW